MRRTLSPRAYLAAAAASAAVVLGLAWTWVTLMPLAFLDPEYPAWAAKSLLLARCEPAEVIVLGDSRAAADIIPALLPRPTLNLAVGGGEAVEALSALRRALACPRKPRLALISLNPTQFMRPDLFWERTVRFGFLSPREVAELAAASRQTGDWSVYENGHGDGLTGRIRAALYAIRFPSLYFDSLVKGGVFLRLWDNRRALAERLAARGQYFFGTAPGCDEVAADGHLDVFRPLPVLDAYFDRMLALLQAEGVRAEFIAMPVNEATRAAASPALLAGFNDYLRGYEAKYPGFRAVGAIMPAWPDRLFGDDFSHLNPEGARLFSLGLARCLDGCALARDDAPESREASWSRHQAGKSPASIAAASATSSSPR